MIKKIFVSTILLLALFVSQISAQTGIARAQAMFIYNFSRLIEWPANYKSGPFVIGVVGNSDLTDQLKSYTAGKSVGSQPITVKQFDSPTSISTCHILFVPFSSTKHMTSIDAQVQNKSTLIISEKNGATKDGSAINFIIVGDKLKFELASANATKYNIKISSKLSEMAYKVY